MNEHVWYMNQITNTTVDPRVDAFHSQCLHADVITEDDDRDIELVKNVYYLLDVFVADHTRLVINRVIYDKLVSTECGLRFRPVRFGIAWNYPFRFGNKEFERDSAYTAYKQSDYLDCSSFVKKYQCDPPNISYYEIKTTRFQDFEVNYADARMVAMIGNARGRNSGEVMISAKCVNEHGIYCSNGFVVRRDIYEVLRPHVKKYAFWVQKILL